MLIPSWRPNKRNVVFSDKPDYIPDWIYVEGMTAKRFYNEQWEFWVWQVCMENNCSQAEAEDACIRGLKKTLLQIGHVYGGQVGKWFEEFLDMGDIFNKVKHPQYNAKLGD